jgi:hypothetical protein
MRKVIAGVAVVALVIGMAAAPRADAASGRRHSANHLRARHDDLYSTNWSGYAVGAKPGERITAITGSWVVPLIRPVPPGFSSSWLGIGGYTSKDLIQVGTSSNGRLDDTYAWFELLPDFETRITGGCARDASCSVRQGDHMAASITNNGGDSWTIMLANLGNGVTPKWYWAKTLNYHSRLSSAEWVFEAPGKGVAVGLPIVKHVPIVVQTTPAHAPHARFFGGTYTVNGAVRGVTPNVVTRIYMTDLTGIAPMATPSDMAGDGHFQVCAYTYFCDNF